MNHHVLRLLSICLSTAIIAWGGVVSAQTWYWPKAFAASVQIKNPTAHAVTVSLQAPDGSGSQEAISVSVAAGAVQTVNWSEDWSQEWIRIESTLNLPLEISSAGQMISSGWSDRAAGTLPLGLADTTMTLQILNLSSQKQTHLRLRHEDVLGLIYDEDLPELAAQSALNWPIPASPGQRWSVQGDYALTAVAVSAAISLSPSLARPTRSQLLLAPSTGQRYFLMLSEDRTRSYVLPLSDATMIDEALQEISGAHPKQIWVAHIQPGHGDNNRNLADPNRPVWSWNVSEVMSFGTFGSQSCNGDAQYVEDHLDNWLQTHPDICFWGYHIDREINSSELR